MLTFAQRVPWADCAAFETTWGGSAFCEKTPTTTPGFLALSEVIASDAGRAPCSRCNLVGGAVPSVDLQAAIQRAARTGAITTYSSQWAHLTPEDPHRVNVDFVVPLHAQASGDVALLRKTPGMNSWC